MEYLVTVTETKEPEWAERANEIGKDSRVVYQQRMPQDFNLSRLILALNVQKRKRVKKETAKEK